MTRVILASRSPRRSRILRFAGVPFRVVVPEGVSEDPLPGESPSSLVGRLALAKALKVSLAHPRHWVLGSDTTVILGGRSIGKPLDRSEAASMIMGLQGRTHTVMTGAAWVGMGGTVRYLRVERSRVRFKPLRRKDIEAYVRTREPYDKAGAYDIQGSARRWIADWSGDYFNVMGLPLRWVLTTLNKIEKRSAVGG